VTGFLKLMKDLRNNLRMCNYGVIGVKNGGIIFPRHLVALGLRAQNTKPVGYSTVCVSVLCLIGVTSKNTEGIELHH